MNKPLGCRLTRLWKSGGIILVAYYYAITYYYFFRGALKVINQGLFRNYHIVVLIFGIRVGSDVVLTGPLDGDQTGTAAHKVPHLVHSYPNSSGNTSTGAQVPHPWWVHLKTLLIKNIDTKLVGTALPRNIKKPCEVMLKHQTSGPFVKNHRLASCHFRALARSKSSCAWATSRSMAPGGPWCGWSQKDPPGYTKFIPKKCHFRSLLNDELSICCTNVTNIEASWAGSCTAPRMFEISQWLEIKNTSQNLERCMGSKTLAIVNAIKNLSPPQLTMIQSSHISHPYSSSILIIHSCHILSLFTHIWELKISQIRIHLAFTELEPSNFTVHDTYNLQL